MQQINQYLTKNQTIEGGSVWFRRLLKECKQISPHIRFKRIKYGFYRIYWRQAYLHEVYKEMPMNYYNIENDDIRLESQKYYEELEDGGEITRKVKNYVEGYYDSIKRIRTRVYMMQNDPDFYKAARNAYKQMRVT